MVLMYNSCGLFCLSWSHDSSCIHISTLRKDQTLLAATAGQAVITVVNTAVVTTIMSIVCVDIVIAFLDSSHLHG